MSGRGLPPITLHGNATIVGDAPLCVASPASAWSYAASFPIEGASDGDLVADLGIRVRAGLVGVSFVDRDGQSLRHELVLSPSCGPCRMPQVIARNERGRLMIRTGPDDMSAQVEILDLDVRPVRTEELTSIDVPAVLEPVEGWSAFFGNYARSTTEQLRSLRFQRMRTEISCSWLERLSVNVVPGEQISRALYVSGLYEPNSALVLKAWLQPGMTFIDIGANIGLFTLLGSRWVGASGRVIAVEPSPRERQRLITHLRVNAIHNVEVVDAAVSERTGNGDLLVAMPEHSGLNTLAPRFAYSGVAAAETVVVPLVTLNALVARAGLERVDVIKLDVEGGEYAALKGGEAVLRRFRPRLIIEVVGSALEASGASAEALASLLSQTEYELFEIDDDAALSPLRDLRDRSDDNVVAIPRESSTPALEGSRR